MNKNATMDYPHDSPDVASSINTYKAIPYVPPVIELFDDSAPFDATDSFEKAIEDEGAIPSQIDAILEDRGGSHGDFGDMASLCQELKTCMRSYPHFAQLPATVAEVLDSLCLKMARIVIGDHTHPDHFRDVEGYGKLGSRHSDYSKFR